jgi:predicted Zn-dependent peptidase
MQVTRKEIAPLVFLTCLTTDKFKTGTLRLCLLDQLTRENAAKNALIPHVLRRGSALHPDLDSLAGKLDELYGARLEPMAGKLGEIQLTGFAASFIDDAFAPHGEPILREMAELTCELLLNPRTRGGLLLPQYVDSERAKLLDRIRGVINNKRAYSMHRLRELMCFGEDYAVPAEGTEAEAEGISYQKLTRHYRELLSAAPMEILYCGSVAPNTAADIFRSALETLPRSEEFYDMGTDIRLNTVEESPRYYTEALDVTQGKLAIGFRLGDYFEDGHLPAIQVMNALYGGSVNSKLFMNVREKLSLCYFASSGVDTHKGVMLVSSGIEFDKYDVALREIFAQLESVQRGDFTADELLAAQKSVSSDLRSMMDTPAALMAFWLGQNVRGFDYGPEELAELIESVTAEEVVAAAKSVQCDAVYFLKGLEKEAAENAENAL